MDFNVVVGPPLPDVSCSTTGDTLIELSGEAGGTISSKRVVVGVTCTRVADYRVSIPQSGYVPITSGVKVQLSFDDGSTSMTIERSSGANVGLNARINQPIVNPGTYYGSTVMTLDLL
ncbi:hypothetical protein ABQ366_21360 [Serratia fonticola]|uniref:hypothetical protein n=1 Tax=Serratia fonticola TaxID=47917 RepID=UPI003AAB61E0